MLMLMRFRAPTSIVQVASIVALLFAASGCRTPDARATSPDPVSSIRIGYGLVPGTTAEFGIEQLARIIATETLVGWTQNGRTHPVLADSWSVSEDGLVWRIHLRPSVRFHDGTPADAAAIREILAARLKGELGPAFEDVREIRTAGPDLEITLRRRSTFILEALTGIAIRKPGEAIVGTGPFRAASQEGDEVEMVANSDYYGGKPSVDRISIKPYPSVRAAWADMLRGQVDMLYDVGIDALDSLKSAKEVNVYPFLRGYAYLIILNVQKPYLKDPGFRRELNAAIDRDAVIAEALNGHGAPSLGAVWPRHWAYTAGLPQLGYRPHPAASGSLRRRLTILVGEPSQERQALVVQRQLQAIGIDLVLELVPNKAFSARVNAGDFDAVLADFPQGPGILRPYSFWHTDGPYNYGHYSNTQVDDALDSIGHAVDDTAYRNGVVAFQRAIVDDPPAIFLSWRERARAISTRFTVPSEPGSDVLATIHLWQPVASAATRGRN